MGQTPKNIRQIGGREDRVKVYMEDYVNTYLRRVQELQEENGIAGMLVGSASESALEAGGEEQNDSEKLRVASSSERYISGALTLSQADLEGGRVYLPQNAWTECYEKLGTYFSGQELCGIFVCEGSCRRFRRQALFGAVREAFPDQDALLYLLTEEGEEIFYRITARGEERLQGYYCYFERNEAMQEYMMDNLPQRRVEWEAVAPRRGSAPTREEPAGSPAAPLRGNEGDLGDPAGRFRSKMQRQRQAKNAQSSGRSVVALCAVMALVIFVSGMGLVYREKGGIQIEDLLQRLNIDPSRLSAVSAQPDETGERYEAIDPGKNSAGSSVIVEEIPGNVYPTEPPESEQETPESESEGAGTEGATETTPIETEASETEAPTTEAPTTEESTTETPTTAETEGITLPANAGVVYVVQAGDSLYSISRRFYGTEEMASVICDLNGLDDPDLIKAGQELLLP